jgi:hypothetical protein
MVPHFAFRSQVRVFLRKLLLVVCVIAFATGASPAQSQPTSPPALAFHLWAKIPQVGDPTVKISIVNLSDDDFGLHPAQWILAQKLGHGGRHFILPLALARRFPSAYAVVPVHGTIYLSATSPVQAGRKTAIADSVKIGTTAAPFWISLHELHLDRNLYGPGDYSLQYCSHVWGRTVVCSNSVTVRL